MTGRLEDLRNVKTTIYEPAEDSALLAQVAVERIDGHERVLDLGCGTGFVGTRIRDRTGAEVYGSDINPYACRRTSQAGLEVVRGDLLDPFRENTFDVVVFNPPYLPTNPDEERDDWLEQALSGGESGRRVIDPFLHDVRRIIRPSGFCLLLVSTVTGIDAVVDSADRSGFSSIAIADESFPFETITVLKLVYS